MRPTAWAMILGAGLLSAWLTEPAAAKSNSSAVTAARQKFFGLENVNPQTGAVRDDQVIISWTSNASFAASIKGHVVLLDTFATRLEVTPGRTPFVIQDLVNLNPEVIFIGHGHFDHADNAAYIAQQTGAPIFATPETCDNMALDATRNFNSHFTSVPTVTCQPVTTRGSIPGSEIVPINALSPDVNITAFKHLHSTNTGVTDPTAVPIANPDPAAGNIACLPTRDGNTVPCNLMDPRDPSLFPAGTLLSTVMDITTNRSGPGGPISLFYVFTVNGGGEPFRFVWHNSTGDIIDSCALPNNNPATGLPFEPGQDVNGCFPGVMVHRQTVGANLAAIMDGLGRVDLQIGAVVSLGFNQNGERDIVSYISHVRPRYFIPNHMTTVGVESSSLEWKVGFEEAVTAFGLPPSALPKVLWIVDPNDYLRPIRFDLNTHKAF
jgi:hypothetical protein